LPAEDRFNQSYFFAEVEDPDSSRDKRNRPGFMALLEAIRGWRRCFPVYGGPASTVMLTMRDSGQALHIVDTRPCAARNEIELSGLARAVHLLAEESIGERQLAAALAKDFALTPSEREISNVVEELRDAHLLLSVDGRHISLALPENIPAWPYDVGLFPGGGVDLEKAAAIEKNLANRRNLVEVLM
jgi:hypothetical protein